MAAGRRCCRRRARAHPTRSARAPARRRRPPARRGAAATRPARGGPPLAGDLRLGDVDEPDDVVGRGAVQPDEGVPPEDELPAVRRQLPRRAGCPRVMPPKLVSPTYLAAGAPGSIAGRTAECTPEAPTSEVALELAAVVEDARPPAHPRCARRRPWRHTAPRCRAARPRPSAPGSRWGRFIVSAGVPSARGVPRVTEPSVATGGPDHGVAARGEAEVAHEVEAADGGQGVEAVRARW